MGSYRLFLGGALLGASLLLAAPSFAETTFRLDASAPGEADPDKGIDYIGSVLAFNIYDALIVPGQGGVPVAPHVANAWNIDGKAYTFTLRTDVKFHSGNPLTADDVVFSFNRLMALGKGNSPLFADRVDSVTAVDPQTVKFTQGQLRAVPGRAGSPADLDSKFVIAHKADGKFGEFGDYGEACLSSHDAGSGAYTLVSHVPESETNLAKFDGYFLGVSRIAPGQGARPLRLAARHRARTGGQRPAGHDLAMAAARSDARARGPARRTHLLSDRGSEHPVPAFEHRQGRRSTTSNCRLALTYAFDYATAMKLSQITDNVSAASPASGAIGKSEFGFEP